MSSVAAVAGGGATETATSSTKKTIDLTDKLDKTACYARNEHNRFPWTNLIIGDTRLGCKSDADEQLILHFEFNEFVRVHSIKLTEFNNGVEPEENPTRILLFVNRVNLGFEDIEDVDPTTTIELTAEDLKENADKLLLKFVQYQRVKSITVFVEDNNGGDISALGGLKFFGLPVATTNMADFKKQG
mmetsp:Transcript_24517/g.53711  ORF Transcript_24517/g.53711 Transcript_24517/m.53711 type:complete len:187 (-) Transcript_24517:944-1504(-)|eukprot:CAMPEP_0168218448 /NCGR_PEP_ID=MMETSP0140_2-20121125/7914_1 /TAXON_ID=44445 /ORGANISM="Pseudo-nitzschia australis, Strain 10249 10 AB" /LENGTH=186 /DNA_ID=CAMNT_0008146527 /DNA_START=248 /DNA_END=808 /DNA_ORIENTATION=+